MIEGWVVVTAALIYIGLLFGVAYFGDRQVKRRGTVAGRPLIYALSMTIYCTSWTFFGSVGLAATSGLDFIPVYLGASLMIGVGWPLLMRIIQIAKNQNITSVADFIAARYGKSQALAAVVPIVVVAGTLPYIALQLKAVSNSVTTVLTPGAIASATGAVEPYLGDLPFAIAMALAAFAVLFGTRHIDATEHQDGLMLAVAMESVVKIVAFLTVGVFVTFFMFDGLGDLYTRAVEDPRISALFTRGFDGGTWLTVTFLSLVCIILLPRQFHVAVVENHSEREVRMAAWLFPCYLILINIFVVPIAIAGLITFPSGSYNADLFVLALPMSAGAKGVTLFAFLGGLSAATAMVIVASVALAIMVSNGLIVPFILRRKSHAPQELDDYEDVGALLLNIRRFVIFAILALAYCFHRIVAAPHALASIGLLSFAAIAQLAPAFFIGLMWRGATARGALAGLLAGFSVWLYTMVLPLFVESGWISATLLESGPLGIGLLRPQMLFNLQFDPLTHGVAWSLFANLVAYVSVSLMRPPHPIERLQANVFVQNEFPAPPSNSVRLWRSAITVDDLQRTTARYLGRERAERSFAEFAASKDIILVPNSEADVMLLRYTENLLASAIGAASSRLVLSLLLRRRNVSHRSALKLLDDASEALQYNRDLLQSALDQVGQGIGVFDNEMRLICWNRQFRRLLDLPADLGRVGVPIDRIYRDIAKRSNMGVAATEAYVEQRIRQLVLTNETFQEHFEGKGRVLEVRTQPMPQGGVVTTYTDITERVEAADALTRANETLERRVRERTAELTILNRALIDAKSKADTANQEKTRFLAAAGHDILQPLNAARLYSTSLVETVRTSKGAELTQYQNLASRIDTSLEAVEEILSALLDISRLDAGAMKPEFSDFALSDIFDRLRLEFEPIARAKSLELRFVPTSAWVRSDRRLMRRVLQNLVSNAVKYTDTGRVLIGCRHQGDDIVIEVWDTGPGIEPANQDKIFQEFQRFNQRSDKVPGLGLGLSIVQRIGRILRHAIEVRSVPGKGAVFSVRLPGAQAQERSSRPQTKPVYVRIDGVVVLCIDNEQQIIDSMATLLSQWGCLVVGEKSSTEGLARLKSEGLIPEIILADYHLEDETGIEAMTAIREGLGVDIPTVIITADRSNEVQQDVRDNGLILLQKPLKPAALRALLSKIRQPSLAAE